MTIDEMNKHLEQKKVNFIVTEILSECKTTHAQVKAKCIKCDTEIERQFKRMYSIPCRNCYPNNPYKKRSKETNSYLNLYSNGSPSLRKVDLSRIKLQEYLGEDHTIINYSGINRPCTVLCKIHNKEYTRSASYLKRFRKCIYCDSTFKRQQEIEKCIKKIKDNIDPTYKFINYHPTKDLNLELLCLKCNKSWKTRSADFIKGVQCPCRSRGNYRSKIEKELQVFLEELDLKVENNITLPNCGRLELDLYLPDKNIAIEVNGLYYHSTKIHPDIYYHQNKSNIYYKKGVRIIHIWEHVYNSKPELVKDLIKQNLILSSPIIDIDKCKVKDIPQDEYLSFMNLYSIQETFPVSIMIALWYDNELIACCGFDEIDTHIDLKSFTAKPSYVDPIILTKMVAKLDSKKDITTLLDLDWINRDSNIYIDAGFIVEEIRDPLPMYTDFNRVYKTHELNNKKYYQIWNSGFQKLRLRRYD